MTGFTVIIPARFGSTRLPGKPLRRIAGLPMIRHVHLRAVESGAAAIIVATDDERIVQTCREFGADAVLTSADHGTGTDRLAEVVAQRGLAEDDIVVNLQGDEPLMNPALLTRVADDLAADRKADIATLAVPLPRTQIGNANAVKVVCNRAGQALYFSRAPIPWPRDDEDCGNEGGPWMHHLGIYAYRAGFLGRFPSLEVPAMERLEKLEQLRALYHGYRIVVGCVSEAPGGGVDTEADLARVDSILNARA
ncbi:MAG TPA: 3-deoxy-manno-octulosonate cytidylyltransferase [Gammaproteobacteria bacterium]|nr:3-deoxy-manno-octulosonate cytidylyltransferase [Gammaproteobacteria bacterium]